LGGTVVSTVVFSVSPKILDARHRSSFIGALADE